MVLVLIMEWPGFGGSVEQFTTVIEFSFSKSSAYRRFVGHDQVFKSEHHHL